MDWVVLILGPNLEPLSIIAKVLCMCPPVPVMGFYQSWVGFFSLCFVKWNCFEILIDSHALVKIVQAYTLYPVSPNGSILENSSTISQPEYWQQYSQDVKYFHHHRDPLRCPFIVTPTSLPLLPLNSWQLLLSISIILSHQILHIS